MGPARIPLDAFPDVVLHADELAVKRHPQYAAAKVGDADAAEMLVGSLTNRDRLSESSLLLQGRDVRLLPVHALESEGVNEIPAALAERLSEWLDLPVTESVVQSNTVGHTGASGFQRLANQALFVGEVERGRQYLLVDDFIGQGGTLANLIGYIHRERWRSRHCCYRLDRKTVLRQAGSRRCADSRLERQAWAIPRRLVARKVRVRLRLPYPVGSSLPRKIPGC
jgi:hypothetical protein